MWIKKNVRILTVKSEIDVCSQKEHQESVECNVRVVDPSPKQVPLVVDEGSN